MSFSIKSLVAEAERPAPPPSPFAWSPHRNELPQESPPPPSILQLAHAQTSLTKLELAHLQNVARTNKTRPVSIQVHLTVADFEHLKQSGRWEEIVDLLNVSGNVKIVL